MNKNTKNRISLAHADFVKGGRGGHGTCGNQTVGQYKAPAAGRKSKDYPKVTSRPDCYLGGSR